jgi:predicted helicase
VTFAKLRDSGTQTLMADKSSIVYNSRITLTGIPEDA